MDFFQLSHYKVKWWALLHKVRRLWVHKKQRIPWESSKLSASQKGQCYIVLVQFSPCSRLVSCTLFSSITSCFQFLSFNALPVTYLFSLSTLPVGSWVILSDVSSTWSRSDNTLTSFPSSFCFFIPSSIFLHCSKLAWHWSNIGFVSGISAYSRL